MMMTSRVLTCETLSIWFVVVGCSIPSRKRNRQGTQSNVPGPSSVPTMYPESPDGHGRVRTVPVGNVGRNTLFCEGYGAWAEARGRKRTAENGALVHRGRIAPPKLAFSVQCSTTCAPWAYLGRTVGAEPAGRRAGRRL